MPPGGCLLFCCSLFRYFGIFSISVSYAAEGIQKCEHDHDYEHIRQSSALSVVREASDIQQSSFPPYFSSSTTVHAYRRVSFSSLLVATPCPILPPRNIGLAHPTPPQCTVDQG